VLYSTAGEALRIVSSRRAWPGNDILCMYCPMALLGPGNALRHMPEAVWSLHWCTVLTREVHVHVVQPGDAKVPCV
jgi:hypothetical protein